ncbi:hypothetical protein ACFFX1_42600 [Dactylosporangium sucinum]|uniref:Glycosyl hydrolase family 67 C-terminal domain-containing protein n=1 Tax=Dactylosporangium sucinum TaxID=1424081 RepID=A0A917U6S5_9ACTN|nr:hypothetical protein [Dactylosporangium sucinum]GGM62972.1 hypothetical protein GCM10007977_075690 [Dactylosporangium sucinum]
MIDRRVRSPLLPLVAAAVVLALGAAMAWGISGALGLSFTPAEVPAEPAEAAPPQDAAHPPVITAVRVPAVARLRLAATAVADALEQRGRPRPAVVQETPGEQTAPGGLDVRLVPGVAPESFRLTGSPGALVVEAGDLAGAATGLYTVADRIRSGAEVLPADQRGKVVTPRLGLRLTDAGAVGREPDVAAFGAGTDYSLNTDVVGSALLPEAPWVDKAAVDRISREFQGFVGHALAQGYNGVVVPGFLEYVTFSAIGDGHAVYPAGDDHIARAEALVAAFGPVLRYARDMGMRVYLVTDMLALSPPLERFLERTTGGLDPTSARFWQVYQAGLSELFDRMPFVSGLMVRIGEGGDIFKQPGWDYSSRIAVTTAAGVRAMLTALLQTAGQVGKDVIFRTWTVGVGAVGDLHTNPASYEEVLGGIDDPHLIVSTKYSAGDFYSHLPFNPTLMTGKQRRIVEFQSRREFEGFGALPNDLTVLHQRALQRFLAANPHVEGVWTWTQDGGPLRAGPMSLLLRSGFWQLYDLNSYALGRLARDPQTPAAWITADWARQTFSDDPRTVAAIGRMMAMSREAVTKGLYLAPYAENSVRALGLEPPPMMWIFEWDIVTGDSAVLDSIYAVSRDRVDEAIADGERAETLAAQMRDEVAATDPATWRDATQRARLLDALSYEVELFRTLNAYRTMFLRHAQWLDTGSSSSYQAWKEAETRYRAARDAHLVRFAGDVDLPAYNFTAADLGAERADRDVAMAWTARVLLLLVLLLLLRGALRRPGSPGAGGLRALFLGATRPWRLADFDEAPSRLDRVLVIAVPLTALVASRLVFTWFAAPAHVLLTLGGWALFAATARLAAGRRDPFHLWAAIGGVALLRTALLLAALALRGPGHYWFVFWTEPGWRAAYVVVAFAAFAWLFVATALVLRDRYGLPLRRVVGAALATFGAPLAVLSAVVSAIGLERALTVWNDQLALLPWGLSRMLGITVYLGIPPSLPLFTALAGLLLAVAGALLSLGRRPPRRAAHALPGRGGPPTRSGSAPAPTGGLADSADSADSAGPAGASAPSASSAPGASPLPALPRRQAPSADPGAPPGPAGSAGPPSAGPASGGPASPPGSASGPAPSAVPAVS